MITYILQMNSDLMHPPSVGSAEHNAARSIEAQSLKLGPALFPSPWFTYFRFHKKQSTGQTKKENALHTWRPCRLQSCSWALLLVLCSEPPPWCTTMWKQQLVWAHSGNVPTTLQTYSLVTWWEADCTLIFLKSQDVLATCNYNFHQN